jgi:hypothetical protein
MVDVTERDSCALDVADRGPHESADICAITGLSRQYVNIIVNGVVEKAKACARSLGLSPVDFEDSRNEVV